MKVVRGYILPIRGKDNNPVCVEVLDESEQKRIGQMFKEVIKFAIDAYIQNKFRDGKKLKTAEDLNNLLNAVIFYIKSILYLDPIPSILEAPSFGTFYYLPYTEKQLLLTNYDMLLEYLKTFRKYILNPEGLQKELLSKRREHQDLIYDILKFPADTRPAANTSSLLIHLLTTSAIAVSLYLEKISDLDSEKISILRFASFFHDIGKFFDWTRHEDISEEILHELLDQYIEKDSDAARIISAVSKVIKRKKPTGSSELDDLRDFVITADKLASSFDRLMRFLFSTLNDDLKNELFKKMAEYLEKNNSDMPVNEKTFYYLSNKWEFWDFVGLDLIKKLTLNFCNEAMRIYSENPLFSSEDEEKTLTDKLKIVRIDIKSIQKFIRSNDIRSMNGASRIIDLLIYLVIPLFLVSNKRITLFAENVLYFGGGNITILIPESKYSIVTKEISTLGNNFDVTINFGSSPIYIKFSTVTKRIDSSLRKNDFIRFSGAVSLNVFELCSLCGSKYATEIISKGPEEIHVCKTCKYKYYVGDVYHFSYRLDALKSQESFKKIFSGLNDENQKNFLLRVLEFIAGEDLSKILNNQLGPYYDLAYVRFDGNLMSQFMASAVSLTDAFERSIRIDYAVKNAFRKFMRMLNIVCPTEYTRLVLGLMYLGGDDGAILMPSRIAVPFAIYLAKEFFFEMGTKATLSFGIAVAKPKHPIFALYEAAGYLLDDIGKDNIREVVYNSVHSQSACASNNGIDYFAGSISYFIAESGILSKESLEDTLKEAYQEKLSFQYKYPYIIGTKEENFPRIDTLLSLLIKRNILYLNDNDTMDLMKQVIPVNCVATVSSDSLDDHKRKRKEFVEQLKELLTFSLNSLQISVEGASNIQVKILNVARKAYGKDKSEQFAKEILKALLKIEGHEIIFGLFDLIMLIKILLGGETIEE